MFFKITVLKQSIKRWQLYIVKETKILLLSFHYTTHLQYCKLCFFHTCSYSNCCFLYAASKIVVFVYLLQVVSGAFSCIAYFFNNITCNLALLFRKNSLWASISLFINQNVLIFMYKQTRSPGKKFLIPFSTLFFMLLYVSLYVFQIFRRSSL